MWVCSKWEGGQLDSGVLDSSGSQWMPSTKNSAVTDQLPLPPWGPTATGLPTGPWFPESHRPPRHRDPERTWCESLLMPSPDPTSLLLTLSQAPGDAKPPVCPKVAQSRICKIKRPFRNLLQNRLSTVTLYYLSAEMGNSESLQ